MTYRHIFKVLMFTIVGIISCFSVLGAQSENMIHSAKNIRQVDFLNYTYRSNLCIKEFPDVGLGKSVRLKNGIFSNKDIAYGVVNDEVIYGDLSHDGVEEAVVHNSCDLTGANYGRSEIFIFSLVGKKVEQLAYLDENDLNRDYRRYTPYGGLWSITHQGVSITNGILSISSYADGSHADPEYIVTFQYAWNGKKLVLNGEPKKVRNMDNDDPMPAVSGESQTQDGIIKVGLLKDLSPMGCGCSFSPIVADGKKNFDNYLFLSDDRGRAYINIDGRDLVLKEVGRKQAKDEYGYCAGKRCTYSDNGVKTTVDFRVTDICPPEPNGGCEVTHYDVTITVENNGLKQSVKGKGSCGC